ncbi:MULTISPECIES: ATP-dependent nuclease [unclassified Yoonia]|uniref:ATP-dependent nuclease n=1 Tax=unclassified Yoonia TaxID=2629118 RepID=UPI002AFF3FD4|nr:MULTISPECIES: AAA family ATPase [unclassified Yoonia]
MIRLTGIHVRGFRLLEDVEISVEASSTVIVGRNNSGKTSLTEVLDRFVGDKAGQFRLEDFSASLRAAFVACRTQRVDGDAPASVLLDALPTISLDLTFSYEATGDLGPLSPFIIDLDPACRIAIARIEYAPVLSKVGDLLDLPVLAEGEAGVEDLDPEPPLPTDPNVAFFRHLRMQIPHVYALRVCAIDPTDPTNRRMFANSAELSALIQVGFIGAQRTLEPGKKGDPDVIGKLLSQLFRTADTLTAAPEDQLIVSQMKDSVARVESAMQGGFDTQLRGLLPALSLFGFPGLNDTELRPHTTIDIESVLTDNTRILYSGMDGVHLPEGYNGLGTRNLIYILFQLETIHKSYRNLPSRPAVHLVFIEEPEAHLHPQMQEVFISQLNAAIGILSDRYADEPAWAAQFVVSTHSSHLANAAKFDAIRYFLNVPSQTPGCRKTKVKDFRRGAATISPDDRAFLQQYMTLTKCDLYFADKAILVEGASERIVMPRIIRMVDETLDAANRLGRQYLTVMEIGGAYAQKFFPLLDYLELKSIVITDLDAVQLINGKYRKCPTEDGERTSNSALKAWFEDPAISMAELRAKTSVEKTRNFYRLAYQIPEEGSNHCARSYEDALILANLPRFEIANDPTAARIAWEKAAEFGKSAEAIRFALMPENWNVPLYIREALVWLSEPPPAPAIQVPPPEIDPVVAEAAAQAEVVL